MVLLGARARLGTVRRSRKGSAARAKIGTTGIAQGSVIRHAALLLPGSVCVLPVAMVENTRKTNARSLHSDAAASVPQQGGPPCFWPHRLPLVHRRLDRTCALGQSASASAPTDVTVLRMVQTRGPVSFSIAEAPGPTLPQRASLVRQDLLEEVLPAPHRAVPSTTNARPPRCPCHTEGPCASTVERQICSDLGSH